jgi:hypothetical protein
MNTSIAELEAIRKTVNKYGDGITNGDIALLRSAFHPKAMMYGNSGDSTLIVEIEGLFTYVAAQEAPVTTGEQHRYQITKLDVAGNAASVEMVQENCYGVNYINYFQLLKIEGQWLIVSKAYDVVQAKQQLSTAASSLEQATA